MHLTSFRIFLQEYFQNFLHEFFFGISSRILLEISRETLQRNSPGVSPGISLKIYSKDAILLWFSFGKSENFQGNLSEIIVRILQRFLHIFKDSPRHLFANTYLKKKCLIGFSRISPGVRPGILTAGIAKDLFRSLFGDSFRYFFGDGSGISPKVLQKLFQNVRIFVSDSLKNSFRISILFLLE